MKDKILERLGFFVIFYAVYTVLFLGFFGIAAFLFWDVALFRAMTDPILYRILFIASALSAWYIDA